MDRGVYSLVKSNTRIRYGLTFCRMMSQDVSAIFSQREATKYH